MNLPKVFGELKRRNVYKVAALSPPQVVPFDLRELANHSRIARDPSEPALARLCLRAAGESVWSGLGSAMLISFLWPLTLSPLHWLNYRLLRWNNWGYAGLFLLGNLLITALVLIAREGL